LQRSRYALANLSRDNPCPLVFPPANPAVYRFTAFDSAIFSVQIFINACLIHISNAVFGNIGYGLLILFYFGSVLLPVTFHLFLRVIPNLFKAFLTADSLHLNTPAISIKYASGCAVI